MVELHILFLFMCRTLKNIYVYITEYIILYIFVSLYVLYVCM
jgi:hypothetical protein